MKIFIDIGHPAHVHYFKNIIKRLSQKNHTFTITARDKDIAHYLLDNLNIKFTSRGVGGTGRAGKLLYMVKADTQLFRLALKERPDLFLSFASPYCAQVASMLGKDHIALDDTENARLGQLFYRPFSNTILSPSCFKKNFGSKHLKFPSYMELSYLHPNVFEPDESIFDDLGLKPGEKYVIVRFVGWNATHDLGHKGVATENKIKAVKKFEQYAKVFISSESELPPEIAGNNINIPPEKIHHALAFANMFYGESATMASESAVLGTPAIYLDDEGRGYTDELEHRYGLVFNYTESKESQQKSIQKGCEILRESQSEWKKRRDKLLIDKIDVTAFLEWFVETYPKSKIEMKKRAHSLQTLYK